MNKPAPADQPIIRLSISAGADLASWIVFVTAPFTPHATGLLLHSVDSFAWDLTMIGFAVAAGGAVAPIIWHGTWPQRFLAVMLCVWPGLVLWRYSAWWLLVLSSR